MYTQYEKRKEKTSLETLKLFPFFLKKESTFQHALKLYRQIKQLQKTSSLETPPPPHRTIHTTYCNQPQSDENSNETTSFAPSPPTRRKTGPRRTQCYCILNENVFDLPRRATV